MLKICAFHYIIHRFYLLKIELYIFLVHVLNMRMHKLLPVLFYISILMGKFSLEELNIGNAERLQNFELTHKVWGEVSYCIILWFLSNMLYQLFGHTFVRIRWVIDRVTFGKHIVAGSRHLILNNSTMNIKLYTMSCKSINT